MLLLVVTCVVLMLWCIYVYRYAIAVDLEDDNRSHVLFLTSPQDEHQQQSFVTYSVL